MDSGGKNFRVYVCSVFTDMKEEWNALQERVFPKLEAHALQNDCRFQVIEWSRCINEAAGGDPKSMSVRRKELRRCQDVSPQLNFIMLLGDRYGWRPLPVWISVEDFETILNNIDGEDEKMLLREWYRLDNNCVPPLYELVESTGVYSDPRLWLPVESKLRSVLLEAFQKMSLSPEQFFKYCASAVEKEVFYGVFNPDYSSGRVFGFFRTFDKPDFENTSPDKIAGEGTVRDFFDTDLNGRLDKFDKFDKYDKAAYEKQLDLKKRLKKHLGEDVFEYPVPITDVTDAADAAAGNRKKYIDALCDDVYNSLRSVMEQVVSKSSGRDDLYNEFGAHAGFCYRHGNPSLFVGREAESAAIRRYIENDNSAPFLIYGEPGVGKSALLAHMVELLRGSYDQVVYRFIGASADSVDIHRLLHGMMQEIVDCYGTGAELSGDYRQLLDERLFWMSMAARKKPLIIFIDALELLSRAHDGPDLEWLPRELPPRVRLIVSAWENWPGKKLLFKIVPPENCLPLSPLSPGEREQVLDKRLETWGRTLQPEQRRVVLERFKQNGLPFYLDMVFEEIKEWRSYREYTAPCADIPGLIDALLRRLADEKNHGPVPVSYVLGYLSAAKNGLAEDELLDLLSANPVVMDDLNKRFPHLSRPARFPYMIWLRLYYDLSPYLRETRGDGKVLLSFAQRRFAEAVAGKFLPGENGLRLHRELAGYFKAQPNFVEGPSGKRPGLRKLSELAFQQTCGRLWDELEESLCNFDFIEARCRAGLMELLVNDCSFALESLENIKWDIGREMELKRYISNLKAFERFLREQSEYFQQFGLLAGFCAQQAYNAFRDGPVADAASAYLESLVPDACVLLHHDANRNEFVADPVKLLVMSGHCSYVHCVAVSADGRIAISGSQDEPVFAWDVVSGLRTGFLDGHIGRVTAAALSADGKTAITAGWDKTLRCWDVESETCLNSIGASHDLIDTAALSADGKIAVTGDQGGNVGIWDVLSGRRLHLFELHREPVYAVTMSLNGDIAVSGGGDRELMVWDTRSGRRVNTVALSFAGCIRSLCLSSGGGVLLAGVDDHNVYVWEVDSGRFLKKMEGHSGAVLSVAITADGVTGVSGGADGSVQVWNIETGECLKVLEGHLEPPVSVALSGDGRVAVSGSRDQTVVAWDIAGSDRAGNSSVGARGERETRSGGGVYSSDGSVTVSGKFSERLIIKRDAPAGDELTVEVGEEIKVLNISADGRMAVTAPWGNFLRLWETETGECLGKLEGNGGNITAASFSADGKMGFTADVQGVLRLWDIDSKSCLKIFPCRALAVALSLDGRFALSGGRDKIIRVWYTGTGNCLFKLEGHTGVINSLALSLRGDLAVSAASDKTLRVWDLKKESCIAVKGHHCEITDVSIVGGCIRMSDSCGDVIDLSLKNFLLPSPFPSEIVQVMDNTDSTGNSQNIFHYDSAALESEAEAKNKRFHPKCSICGNRLNMDEAKSKGLTSEGVYDRLGYDYCYFFAKPVQAVNFETRRPRECSHFVSFEVLRFDVDLE